MECDEKRRMNQTHYVNTRHKNSRDIRQHVKETDNGWTPTTEREDQVRGRFLCKETDMSE